MLTIIFINESYFQSVQMKSLTESKKADKADFGSRSLL
jgi:hypothetical protein